MISKTILQYKIFEKIGEGSSPREIKIENRGVISNQRGLLWLWDTAIIIISRGKWALRININKEDKL